MTFAGRTSDVGIGKYAGGNDGPGLTIAIDKSGPDLQYVNRLKVDGGERRIGMCIHRAPRLSVNPL